MARAKPGRVATPRDIPLLDPHERRIRLRLRDDFEHYAAMCLKIAAKDGALVPLRLNRAQRAMHAAVEQQLNETGKVRVLILKGRQQGASTYVEGVNFGGFSSRCPRRRCEQSFPACGGCGSGQCANERSRLAGSALSGIYVEAAYAGAAPGLVIALASWPDR